MSTVDIVKTQAGNVVVAKFPAGTEIIITDRGYVAGKQKSIAFKSIPLVIETGVTEPAKFVPGAQSHAGGVWSVVDQAKYDYAPAIEERKRAKSEKAKEIKDEYGAAVAQLINPYPGEERDSWIAQLEEARQYIDTQSTNGLDMLPGQASERGVSVADLAGKILAKNKVFREAYGTILGRRQGREAALAAINLEAADALDQIQSV